MYDIVFLSYQESNADSHWELLRARFPRAIRVDGVEGLAAAHQTAALRCRTKYFWVVDADNVVDDFDFSFRWDHRDSCSTHVAVWKARNNINGLEYGYGGIKLLPRKEVLAVSDSVVDFTTSISDVFHPMETVASTTVINATPFEAWKAGFRECVKLSSGIIIRADNDESSARLNTWKTVAFDIPNAIYCIRGACEGAEFGSQHCEDPVKLFQINDWKWLRAQFDS